MTKAEAKKVLNTGTRRIKIDKDDATFFGNEYCMKRGIDLAVSGEDFVDGKQYAEILEVHKDAMPVVIPRVPLLLKLHRGYAVIINKEKAVDEKFWPVLKDADELRLHSPFLYAMKQGKLIAIVAVMSCERDITNALTQVT